MKLPPVLALMVLAGSPILAEAAINATLRWTDTAADGPRAETGFRLERKDGAAGTYGAIATLPASPGSGAEIAYNDLGLQASTLYCYRVFAFNTSGDSPPSNEACATSPELPGPPPVPGSLNIQVQVTVTVITSPQPAPSPGP